MQKVKLYTINTQEVLAYDRVRYFLQRPLSHIVHCEDVVLECAEVVDVPVQRVCQQVRGSGKYVEHYLAISPELEEILNAAIEPRYRQTLANLTKGLADATSSAWSFQSRIEEFNKLPWYKRIFSKP